MMASNSFWRYPHPLTLASGSAARRMLLEAVNIPLAVLKAPVDEGAIAAGLLAACAAPRDIALALAHAKAEAAQKAEPDALILTADQTLDHRGGLLMKPVDRAQARQQLSGLRGSEHFLHSAAVLRQGEAILWAGVASARLTMRDFSDVFLDNYLDAMGPSVCETVGGYQLEALGTHLFESIEGDHATILGLPLLALLQVLRNHGFLVE